MKEKEIFYKKVGAMFVHNIKVTIPVTYDAHFIKKIFQIVQVGYDNRIPGEQMAKIANKKRLTGFPIQGSHFREILYFLMGRYGFLIGTSQNGQFFITTLRDRRKTLEYLEKYKLGTTTKYDCDGKSYEAKTKKLQFYENITIKDIFQFKKFLKKYKDF
jgi:hypothetical protein